MIWSWFNLIILPIVFLSRWLSNITTLTIIILFKVRGINNYTDLKITNYILLPIINYFFVLSIVIPNKY